MINGVGQGRLNLPPTFPLPHITLGLMPPRRPMAKAKGLKPRLTSAAKRRCATGVWPKPGGVACPRFEPEFGCYRQVGNHGDWPPSY